MKPKHEVKRELTFDDKPRDIDIAAILKKRFERALEEDKQREVGQSVRAHVDER